MARPLGRFDGPWGPLELSGSSGPSGPKKVESRHGVHGRSFPFYWAGLALEGQFFHSFIEFTHGFHSFVHSSFAFSTKFRSLLKQCGAKPRLPAAVNLHAKILNGSGHAMQRCLDTSGSNTQSPCLVLAPQVAFWSRWVGKPSPSPRAPGQGSRMDLNFGLFGKSTQHSLVYIRLFTTTTPSRLLHTAHQTTRHFVTLWDLTLPLILFFCPSFVFD